MEQHNINAHANGINRNDGYPLRNNVSDLNNTHMETEHIDRLTLAKNVVCIEHLFKG